MLGKHSAPSPLGGGWMPNPLQIEGGNSVPPFLFVRGEMTGVRNSKEFYDTEITLTFRLSDTLGGLRLLGADTSRVPTGRPVETMEALDLLPYAGYVSTARRPVRLLIRKLDPQQRIVSGTFVGMLYGDGGRDSLAVADGRFDCKY